MALAKDEKIIEIVEFCIINGVEKTCHQFNLKEATVERYMRHYKNTIQLNEVDEEIVDANLKLNNEKQKAQDRLRITKKSLRENARIENAVSEYGKEMIDILKTHNELFKNNTIFHEYTNSNGSAIIQLSDLHLNELILANYNSFDFNIASKRLEKFACVCIDYLNHINAKDVFIVATGDMLNSDRRLDEVLSQATNRAKASLLSAHLLKCFIMHINKYFNIKVVSVLGNESRVPQEMSFSDNVLSDNFDLVIFGILREIFRDCPGVEFGSIDKVEETIRIAGKNILARHGFGKGTKNTGDDAAKTIGRLANQERIIIDYIIQGHFHDARGGDIVSRSSSLCGANAYSTAELNLIGRASQLLHVITKHSIDVIKVDLQDSTGYNGYVFPKDLEAYNPKSELKNKERTKIMEIII